jgi:hypothetical protein
LLETLSVEVEGATVVVEVVVEVDLILDRGDLAWDWEMRRVPMTSRLQQLNSVI